MTEELTKIAADKLIEVLDIVTKSVAPAALELAEGAMVISGISDVITGLVLLAVAITTTKAAVWLSKSNSDGWYHPLPFFAGLASCTFYLISPFWLFNIWNWIAIFQPKLAIVNKILKF